MAEAVYDSMAAGLVPHSGILLGLCHPRSGGLITLLMPTVIFPLRCPVQDLLGGETELEGGCRNPQVAFSRQAVVSRWGDIGVSIVWLS